MIVRDRYRCRNHEKRTHSFTPPNWVCKLYPRVTNDTPQCFIKCTKRKPE